MIVVNNALGTTERCERSELAQWQESVAEAADAGFYEPELPDYAPVHLPWLDHEVQAFLILLSSGYCWYHLDD